MGSDIMFAVRVCLAAVFLLCGVMMIIMPFYTDFRVAKRMRDSENRRYVRSRRWGGAAFVLFFVMAYFGLFPSQSMAAGGWQAALVPASITLLFGVVAEVLLGVCDWPVIKKRRHRIAWMPLPILCIVAVIEPQWSLVVAVLQSLHFVLLVAHYTPLCYTAFSNLDKNCWDAVNNTRDDVAEDYEELPESMPWLQRTYNGAMVVCLYCLFAYFWAVEWSVYVMTPLLVAFLIGFFNCTVLRYTRYSRILAYYTMYGDMELNDDMPSGTKAEEAKPSDEQQTKADKKHPADF